MRESLTEKQRLVLDFIRSRISGGERLAPTIREIAARFGFSSTGTVRDHLEALARKGCLTLRRGKARAIELDRRLFGIPIVGRVAAGEPKFADQDIEGYLEPYEQASGEELFCLRVKGDSMKGAGILEGDLVVVRRQPKADPGDIIVALIDDEATVKTLRKAGREYFLDPANERYRPIHFKSPAKVLGKVVTVVRKYV